MSAKEEAKGPRTPRKKRIFKRISISIGLSGLLFVGGVISLVVFSKTATPLGNRDNIKVNTLQTNQHKLPSMQQYEARDGKQLSYRYYDGDANQTIILLHGSAYHSSYLQPLASYISEHQVANVYTPDFRGHGPQTGNRGDVSYIGQLEDDISDLVKEVRNQEEGSVLLGGHSSGGGTVIRYAGGDHASVDGYVLLSPFIHHTAPTYRSDSEWANVNLPRMIGLSILNTFGITTFNHQDVISFNMPETARDGTETLRYSYALQTSMHPRKDYEQDIAHLDQPSFLMVGEADNIFQTDAFQPLFNQFSPTTKVKMLPDTSHFGTVTKEEAQKSIADWLQKKEESHE